MTIKELRSLAKSVPVVVDPSIPPRVGGLPPASLDSHYLSLREAADELLRAFVAISDWSHPAAERYREIRAQARDFGEDE